jgi:hypothetical protein
MLSSPQKPYFIRFFRIGKNGMDGITQHGHIKIVNEIRRGESIVCIRFSGYNVDIG